MSTIKISNLTKPVAVALDWQVLPGLTSESKEIAALAKSAGTRIGSVVADEGTGVTILGLSSTKTAGVPCGAAWLAKASARESIVLIEPLEDGRLWLCAVRAGLPVPGLDVVIDSSDLTQRLPAFIQDGQDPRICSTLDNLLDFGYSNVTPQSFAELVANTKAERLARISGTSPVLIIGGVAVAVALGAWFGGGAYLDQIANEKSAAASADVVRKQQIANAELVRKAAALRREQAIDILRLNVLGQPSVTSLMGAMLKSVESMPTSVAGWNVDGIDCLPNVCQVTWARTPVGTVVGFLQAASGNGWQVKSAAGDAASTLYLVDASAREATVDDLVEEASFRPAFESKLQQLQLAGLHYGFLPAAAVEPPVAAAVIGMPAAPPAGLPALAPLPWKMGTAVVRGVHLFALRGTPDYLDHPGVAIKHVAADMKSNEWTLELTYATR